MKNDMSVPSNPLIPIDVGKTSRGKPVNVRNARQAKRLMGRIIYQFQKNEISIPDSRNLAYLISVYLQVCSHEDLETRLTVLEEVGTHE